MAGTDCIDVVLFHRNDVFKTSSLVTARPVLELNS